MASKKQEITEKLGLKYFKKLDKKNVTKEYENQVYFLDDNERKNIFKISRKAIINSFIIGAFTSAITSIIFFKYGKNLVTIKDYFDESNFNVLIIIGIASLVSSLIEMVLLFFEGLKKSYKITQAAHLQLFPGNETDETFVATSIVRGALELPNPNETDLKINPRKETPKAKAVFGKVIDKTKQSLSIIIFKQIFKSMFGKAIGRAYLSILSIPLMALWNAYETLILTKEIKIRVLGPSAVSEFVDSYEKIKNDISYKAEIQTLRAISSCILSTETLHPNLEFLFRTMKNKFSINTRNSKIDDSKKFLNLLNELNKYEQKFVLNVLEFASIIDGKINKRERTLLKKAYKKCNLQFDYDKTKELLNKFKSGAIMNWANISLTKIN